LRRARRNPQRERHGHADDAASWINFEGGLEVLPDHDAAHDVSHLSPPPARLSSLRRGNLQSRLPRDSSLTPCRLDVPRWRAYAPAFSWSELGQVLVDAGAIVAGVLRRSGVHGQCISAAARRGGAYTTPRMSRLKISVLVAALALASGGCLGQAHLSGGYQAADPILVELQPGVWVIEDYDQPVFYADGFFWMYRDDGWYRSRDHVSGWAYVRAAPQVVTGSAPAPVRALPRHARCCGPQCPASSTAAATIAARRGRARRRPRPSARRARRCLRRRQPPVAPPPRDHQRTDPPGQRRSRSDRSARRPAR
jgi:hypothetical protein